MFAISASISTVLGLKVSTLREVALRQTDPSRHLTSCSSLLFSSPEYLYAVEPFKSSAKFGKIRGHDIGAVAGTFQPAFHG